MNDMTKLVVYSTAAAGFTAAAHRSATRLGLPAAVAGLLGGLLYVALTRG